MTGIVCLYFLIVFSVRSQGCVAIRSGCGANVGGGAFLSKGQIQVGSNFRYFHSYKHFRGAHEETYRVKEGSEVINDSFFLDFLFSYGLTDRLSVNFTLPFVYHERSSMYEHGGNPSEDDPSTAENEYWPGDRHTTVSKGLADMRIGVSYWLWDPAQSSGSNLSVGLGVKFASGDYRAEDQFYNQGDNEDQVITSGVDQSIQPGDGGVGIALDVLGYHQLGDRFTLTGSVYYLANPREQYSLENRGRMRDYSVPDQYAMRLGALYMLPLHGLFFYGGARMEGVPSSDFIGGDEGFRRPGYVVSLEPGISYGIRNTSFNVTVPIAIERNRTKSYSDKQNGSHGDAAFADYLINVGFTWKFGGKNPGLFGSQEAAPTGTN